jgi:HlyD family secretion protein
MDDIEREPPARMTRATLYLATTLLLILLLWSALARLDIIASAQGRLVPQSFVKIVQPADGGIVQDILVSEGQRVRPGQVLMRMDGQLIQADAAALKAELDNKQLQLRRIDAELAGALLMAREDEAQPALFEQIQAQHRAHRQNYLDNLSQEQEVLRKSTHELDAARATQTKLRQSVPLLQAQAQGYASLGSDGFFPALQV